MNNILSIEDKFLNNLAAIVKTNLGNERFGVNELASEAGVSRATLHRKLKSICNKTATQFINEVRLKEADLLLHNRTGNVSEIAYQVGFQSSTYFIKCYKEYFGFPPGEVLKGRHEPNKNTKSADNSRPVISFYKYLSFLALAVLLFVAGETSFVHFQKRNGFQKKILTSNITALNLYNQGLNLMDVYVGSREEQHFMEAKSKFERAVKLDSTFGDAYAHIADIYLANIPFYPKTNKGFNYADSGKVYIDLAEKFGVKDTDFLLQMKSFYCRRTADFDGALMFFEEFWKNKIKDYNYYEQRGNQAFHAKNYYETLKYFMKYLELKPDSVLPVYDRLFKISLIFSHSGFQKEAQEFAFRQYQLNNEKINYWTQYPYIAFSCGNFNEAVKSYEAAYLNSNADWLIYNKLLEIYMLTAQHEKALRILPEFEKFIQEKYSKEIPNYLLGYYNQLKGESKKAEWHFNELVKKLESSIGDNNFQEIKSNYLTLASCHAMLYNKEGVIKNLEKLEEKTSIPYLIVVRLERSPMFNNFRNDRDFKRIKSQIEQKYYNERLRIEEIVANSNMEYTFNLNENIVSKSLQNMQVPDSPQQDLFMYK